jgi:hypothetical protein
LGGREGAEGIFDAPPERIYSTKDPEFGSLILPSGRLKTKSLSSEESFLKE